MLMHGMMRRDALYRGLMFALHLKYRGLWQFLPAQKKQRFQIRTFRKSVLVERSVGASLEWFESRCKPR